MRSVILTALVLSVAVLSSCNGCSSNDSSANQTAASSSVKSTTGISNEEFQEFAAGEMAPEVLGPGVDGSAASLFDYRGKTVLLNFWATWCIPCVAEMPALERVYKKFKDRGFVVLAVSVDQDDQLVSEFVAQNGLSFPVIRDREFTLASRFGISGFPETFLVSPEGKFISTLDPETKKEGVRIISDRAWDSDSYLEFIGKLLPN